MPTDQIVLVTGAAGHQGGAVARCLLERNFLVRAFVRHPDKPGAKELAERGAEVVQGDFEDRTSLDRAMTGVYGVFSVQDYYSAGAEREVQQGKNVADAALKAGVKHLVYSSVGSAHRDTGIPHFQTKWQIEEHIRSIGVPHTILRPVFFYYNYERLRDQILGGVLAQPLHPGQWLQQLSEDDYAIMVATALNHPQRFLGRAIDVASTNLKMDQTAESLSRVIGRPVEYRQILLDEFEQHAGREITMMYRWFESTGYDADLDELRREFGELTNLEAYLRAHGWEGAAA